MEAKNKAELVIHIGPPKTATTSLQEFFQNLKSEEIIYGGTYQPRTAKPTAVINLIYRYPFSLDKENLSNEIKSFIKENLDQGKNIFLSEEMFLLESPDYGYESKLKNLFEHVKEFNPKILIVVRNPKEALQSYYTELYHKVDTQKIRSFKDFIFSKYCEVYKYSLLIEKLRAIGFAEVKVLKYENLVAGEYKLSTIFPNIKDDEQILLTEKNVSKKLAGKRYAKPVPLKQIILRRLAFLRNVPLLKSLFGLGLGKLVPAVEVKGKPVNVNISPDELKEFMDSYNRVIELL